DWSSDVCSSDLRVYHYGVRSPFRVSWDTLAGDFYFGEVGQDSHEEINIAPAGSAGLNFGWPAWEGDENTCPDRKPVDAALVTPPVFFTDHGGGAQFGA